MASPCSGKSRHLTLPRPPSRAFWCKLLREFIFRGYITQGLLLALKRPWPAAIVSGLLFGSLHTQWCAAGSKRRRLGIVSALIAIQTRGIALTCGLTWQQLFRRGDGRIGSDVFVGTPEHRPDHATIGLVGLALPLRACRYCAGGSEPVFFTITASLGARKH